MTKLVIEPDPFAHAPITPNPNPPRSLVRPQSGGGASGPIPVQSRFGVGPLDKDIHKVEDQKIPGFIMAKKPRTDKGDLVPAAPSNCHYKPPRIYGPILTGSVLILGGMLVLMSFYNQGVQYSISQLRDEFHAWQSKALIEQNVTPDIPEQQTAQNDGPDLTEVTSDLKGAIQSLGNKFDKSIDNLNRRIDAVQQHNDEQIKHLSDGVSSSINKVESKVDNLQTGLKATDKKLTTVEERMKAYGIQKVTPDRRLQGHYIGQYYHNYYAQ